jgi:hypothetical protein
MRVQQFCDDQAEVPGLEASAKAGAVEAAAAPTHPPIEVKRCRRSPVVSVFSAAV